MSKKKSKKKENSSTSYQRSKWRYAEAVPAVDIALLERHPTPPKPSEWIEKLIQHQSEKPQLPLHLEDGARLPELLGPEIPGELDGVLSPAEIFDPIEAAANLDVGELPTEGHDGEAYDSTEAGLFEEGQDAPESLDAPISDEALEGFDAPLESAESLESAEAWAPDETASAAVSGDADEEAALEEAALEEAALEEAALEEAALEEAALEEALGETDEPLANADAEAALSETQEEASQTSEEASPTEAPEVASSEIQDKAPEKAPKKKRKPKKKA